MSRSSSSSEVENAEAVLRLFRQIHPLLEDLMFLAKPPSAVPSITGLRSVPESNLHKAAARSWTALHEAAIEAAHILRIAEGDEIEMEDDEDGHIKGRFGR
jgi:hypothetical protein